MVDTTPRDDGPGPAALVTGASSGIGLAVARRLLAGGWRVTGVDRAASAIADATGYRHLRADLCEPPDLAAVEAAAAQGRWAGFVHAAGVMRDDADPDTRAAAGAALWQLHVGAAARLGAAIAPRMQDGRGRIVILSSRAAQGRAGRIYYAASKAAVDGLVRSLAAELVFRGVTVNAVAPAATDTPQLRDPGRAGARVAPLPIGRLIEPGEVAATVAFLLAPEAGAITGQTLIQCGGASLAPAPPRPAPETS